MIFCFKDRLRVNNIDCFISQVCSKERWWKRVERYKIYCLHIKKIVYCTQSLDAISFILNMNPKHCEHEYVHVNNHLDYK